MELRAEDIQAAAERLRGQTVHTPLIGDVMLRVPLSHEDDPEAEIIAGPRIKAECVQTGGSVDHRGAVHFLLRQLGSLKGLVITGEPYRLLACARAGHSHRLPMIAACWHPVPRADRELTEACGCEVQDEVEHDVAVELARQKGYRVMPSVEDPDFALGVATLGLELGAELASDLGKLYVAPGALGAPIAAGMRAAGHAAEVVAVDSELWRTGRTGHRFAPWLLHRALVESLNLLSHIDGIAALSQALEDGAIDDACVILSC